MAKHRGEAHEEHMDESWLIPYADLLTLLLALFIVLYASSNVDQEKFNAMAEKWQEVIERSVGAGMTYIPMLVPDAGETAPPEEGEGATEQESMLAMQAMIEQYLAEQGIESQVTTSIDDRGLVISMNDAILFDPGSGVIKPEYRDVLIKIGETINRLNNYIRVEGHTDNIPESSMMYPTNWELSGARAASVVRLFIDESHIDPYKLMAAQYGEFRPIADNSTPEGRSKNRRVDIIILNSMYNALENQRTQ